MQNVITVSPVKEQIVVRNFDTTSTTGETVFITSGLIPYSILKTYDIA